MKVYLSSTLDDLLPERQSVDDALRGLPEWHVVHSYDADERNVRASCLDDVAKCDLYIGIIGRRYGSIPKGERLSITELEYEQARSKEIPTLIFMKHDHAILRIHDDEITKENDPRRIEKFRQTLSNGSSEGVRLAVFRTPDELKQAVLRALLRWSQRQGDGTPKRIEGPPYPGLRAFRADQADRFFGRDAEKDALAERLLVSDQRFLAVIGPSGSGKSSLVHAGLLPMLTRSAAASGSGWFVAKLNAGNLTMGIATELERLFPDVGLRAYEIDARLRAHPAAISDLVLAALGKNFDNTRLLIFVDQFEEVFAGRIDITARCTFFDLLKAAVQCKPVRVVIAMRSDFYSEWPQDEASVALLTSGHFAVGLPGTAALEKMIVDPAKAAGLIIPQRLVDRILTDAGTPPALALVQFALAQLYERKANDTLSEADYDAIGRVFGAIDRQAAQALSEAKATVDALGTPLNDVLSRLLLVIASVEEKEDKVVVVRRRAAKSELSPAALTLAGHLVEKRLLVASQGPDDAGAVYEVAHEAVFSHWKAFGEWYDEYGHDLALRRQAERAAAEWERAKRPAILRWGWERQRPAIAALHELNQLPEPPADLAYADRAIAMWRAVEEHVLDGTRRDFLYPEPLALMAELGVDATPHHRREEIGLRLNQMGDPRRGVGLGQDGLPDIAWIDVPGGEVTLANNDDFRVEPLRVARYPVTWAQYLAFLDAEDGYRSSAWWDRPEEESPGVPLWSFANYPAINVSWYDAMAYCGWLSAKLGFTIRLPAEWEWQWAAAGPLHHQYPWGAEWNPAHTNTGEAGIGRTVAVGLYPLARSAFGLDNMVGNVWEWCLNVDARPADVSVAMDFKLHWREHYGALRVVRGGSWADGHEFARCAKSVKHLPGSRNNYVGFRLCCSPSVG
jgi:hypothetical protein